MELDNIFSLVSTRSDDWTSDGNNSSTIFDINFLERHQYLSFTYITVVSIFLVLGCCGNIMVIASVIVYRKLRTTGNLFIVNLAIADLCVTAFVDVFSIIGVVGGPSFFRDKLILCHMVACICLVSCSCSLWNMAAVAVDRYIFLCKNFHHADIFTWKKTPVYCVSMWIICFLFELPNFLGWGGHTFDLKTMACSYDRLADVSYTVFFCLVAIGIPLLTVLVSYVKIFLYVRKIRRSVSKLSENVPKQDARVRAEIELAKTLFVVFCSFLFFWSPYAVIVLIDQGDHWSKVVYVVVIQMAHTNSSVNFILYAALNKRFRRGYKAVLAKFACTRRTESPSSVYMISTSSSQM